MNQYRRKVKTSKPAYLKPWKTNRNKSCSPSRNPKRPADMHRVAFADYSNQGRTLSQPKNDSLHAVVLSHMRCQLPTITNPVQNNMMYKQSKDNQNINIKQTFHNRQNVIGKEKKYPNLKYLDPRLQSNQKNTVYFENGSNTCEKLYSSSETNISSHINNTPCKNQSVRNVIEKFNRLCNDNDNYVDFKQTFKREKEDPISMKEIREGFIIEKQNNEIKKEENKTNKNVKNIQNPSQKPENSIQLRSQRIQFIKNKDYTNVYCDDLLEIFKPQDNEEIIQKISLIPRKSIDKFQELEPEKVESNVKALVSTQTQTTPCPSATNIMINVYNQKSPRLLHQRSIEQNPIEIKISQDAKDNTELSISLEKDISEERKIDITKKSVKSCIENFEANLRKNGMEPENEVSDTKIFSKIRSNYLLKKEYAPVLSPRAKSVPF